MVILDNKKEYDKKMYYQKRDKKVILCILFYLKF